VRYGRIDQRGSQEQEPGGEVQLTEALDRRKPAVPRSRHERARDRLDKAHRADDQEVASLRGGNAAGFGARLTVRRREVIRVCNLDHAIEHLRPECNLALPAWHLPGAQLRPNQALVAADRGLNQAAPFMSGCLPPS